MATKIDRAEIDRAKAWLLAQRRTDRVNKGRDQTTWHHRRRAEAWHRWHRREWFITDAAFHKAVRELRIKRAPSGPLFWWLGLEVVDQW